MLPACLSGCQTGPMIFAGYSFLVLGVADIYEDITFGKLYYIFIKDILSFHT